MTDPHAGLPLARAGALADAVGAVVLVHGRGATPESILALADALGRRDWAHVAPRAAGGSWYPNSFLAPIEANEPWLSSAVRAVTAAVQSTGQPQERVVLGGFSQGACLAVETAARLGGHWGGVFAWSGALIGTGPGAPDLPPLTGMGGLYPDKAFDYPDRLDGTPVLIAGSDIDPHIPLARMERSADALRQRGAAVDLRVYPGAGHAVNADEVAAVRALLSSAVPSGVADVAGAASTPRGAGR